MNAKFGEDALHVSLHGFFRDGELDGDLFIRIPARNQAQNLDFPRGQGFIGGMLGEFHGRLGRDPFHLRAVRAGAQLAGNALERLLAVQHLHEHVTRFAVAEKAAAFGIWEWFTATGLFALSESTALMARLTAKPTRVTAEELYATVHPDDQEPARLVREDALQRGGSYEHEFRRMFPDGSCLGTATTGQSS